MSDHQSMIINQNPSLLPNDVLHCVWEQLPYDARQFAELAHEMGHDHRQCFERLLYRVILIEHEVSDPLCRGREAPRRA